MQRSIRRSACAVLALIALSLTGTMTQCGWKGLTIEIPDFESSQVAGLQLWRADEVTGQEFTEVAYIVFGDHFFKNGSEVLEYTMLNSQDQPLDAWEQAAIIRGENDDAVRLHFIFAGWSEPPGWIRATSFNAAGESNLSEEAQFL